MIRLTRLNNKLLVVNSDLIKFIENAPDTVLTLVSGEKIIVLESSQEIIERVIAYRRQLIQPVLEEARTLVSGPSAAEPEMTPETKVPPSRQA
jgi:flagellar protein FlbD